MAYFTACEPISIIFSRDDLNLCSMCESDVPIPVCILGRLAVFKALAATSISFFTALVSPHTVAFSTIFEISTTDLKSPGLETGKPASMMSTPNSSSLLAITSF